MRWRDCAEDTCRSGLLKFIRNNELFVVGQLEGHMFAFNIQPYYFSRHKCQQHFSVLSLHFRAQSVLVVPMHYQCLLECIINVHWQGIINAHRQATHYISHWQCIISAHCQCPQFVMHY